MKQDCLHFVNEHMAVPSMLERTTLINAHETCMQGAYKVV